MSDLERVTLFKSLLAKPMGTATPEEIHACEELALACSPAIRGALRGARLRPNEVADAEQDVWIVVLRKLPKLQYDPHRAPFAAWVRAIAERLARKRVRRWRFPPVRPLGERHADTLVDREPGPVIELELMQEHELFQDLVAEYAARLPERDGRIVTNHWLEERSLSRIASDLNMSDDAVWWVIRRVTPKLLDFLRRRGLRPS
jgi:RNA polymerase sigma factor (sigma-70 family)